MKPSSVQWAKELRQLGWPWALVTLGGLLSFVHLPTGSAYSFPRSMLQAVVPLGVAFGIPLLAALPLGSEFQYRTLALRLAQPIDRREIWRQKLIITFAAVVPAAAIYLLSAWYNTWHEFWGIAVWLVVSTAAAILSTLIARSTIGGLALSAVFISGPLWAWILGTRHFWGDGPYPAALIWGTVAAIVLSAGALLWLGRRMLLNFQATEGMQAGEAVIPGARLVPNFVVETVRCRPGQPILNLVRREVRLLRMVWPLSFLSLAAWICVAIFRLVPSDRNSDPAFFAFAMTIVLSVLIAVLAGTLSLGEEKSWGTHDAQLTAPVSMGRQWLVKLLVALLTSVVCGALLPMSVLLIGGGMTGKSLIDGTVIWIWPLEVTLVALLSFWCSCMVKGVVRAALWVFPLFFIFTLGTEGGYWLLTLLGSGNGGVIDSAVARLDPVRVNRTMSHIFTGFSIEAVIKISLIPMVAVVLIQSYWHFRGEPGEANLHILRRAVPLFVLVVLVGVMASATVAVMAQSWDQQTALMKETHGAIEALQPGGAAARAQRLTGDDLAKAGPISERNRRLLRDANIVIAPEVSRGSVFVAGAKAGNRFVLLVPGAPGKAAVPYSATIRLASGTQCSLQFTTLGPTGNGVLGGLCE